MTLAQIKAANDKIAELEEWIRTHPGHPNAYYVQNNINIQKLLLQNN